MRVVNMPDNYRGAFEELVYTVSGADPAAVTEVEVCDGDTGDILGIKRFKGSGSYGVNISNFMRRRLAVAPALVEDGANRMVRREGSTVSAVVRCGDTVSEKRVFTAGIRAAGDAGVLSDVTVASIAPGEHDEIPVAMPGQNLTWRCEATGPGIEPLYDSSKEYEVLGDDVYSLIVDLDTIAQDNGLSGADQLAQRYDRLKITFGDYAGAVGVREYEIVRRSRAGVRLAWVNRYGAVDYYTFAVCDSRWKEASKTKGYFAAGYKVYSSWSDGFTAVRSEYEGPDVMKWLSGIVVSPKVWLIEGGRATPVDVVTTQAVTDAADPVCLALVFRHAEREVFQTL